MFSKKLYLMHFVGDQGMLPGLSGVLGAPMQGLFIMNPKALADKIKL